MKTNIKLLGFLLPVFFVSCNEMIEYSSYDVDIESSAFNNIYTENLERIGSQIGDTVSFAFFSDPHFYYDELSEAVSSLNKRSDIAFAVVCGDITESGLAKEYTLYWNHVKKLHYPCITIIGNHDHLSNGAKVYNRLFGPENFSFEYGAFKFIAFDNTVWEKGNVSPDFEWFENEVEESDKSCILLSHIPPWTDQFTPEYAEKFYKVASSPQVMISLHGHQHSYMDTVIHHKDYMVAKAVFKREYYLVHLTGNGASVETVNF